MNYWEALAQTEQKGFEVYTIYTCIDNKRISYVNKYKQILNYLKHKYIEVKKNINGHKTKLTKNDEDMLEEKASRYETSYFIKEIWNPVKGWIPVSKTRTPDDEIMHLILTNEWRTV